MPGDGLTFAVFISCQVKLVSFLQGFAEFGDTLLLVGVHHVVRLETRVNVDGEL